MKAAVKKGLIKVVSIIPLAENVGVPLDLRRAGARGREGKVFTWIIEKDGTEHVREFLTESEKKLPIAAIWDHEILVIRVSEGWSPEQVG